MNVLVAETMTVRLTVGIVDWLAIPLWWVHVQTWLLYERLVLWQTPVSLPVRSLIEMSLRGWSIVVTLIHVALMVVMALMSMALTSVVLIHITLTVVVTLMCVILGLAAAVVDIAIVVSLPQVSHAWTSERIRHCVLCAVSDKRRFASLSSKPFPSIRTLAKKATLVQCVKARNGIQTSTVAPEAAKTSRSPRR